METLFGTLVIAIPVLLIGLFLFWNNYRPVFWMLAGALALGLGYFGSIGSTYELGKPIADAVYSSSGTVAERTMDAAKGTMEKAKEKATKAKDIIKEKAAAAKDAIKNKMDAAKRAAGGTDSDKGSATPGGTSNSVSSPSGRYVTE